MKRKFPKIFSFLVCFLLIFEQSGFAQIAGELNIAGRLVALHSSSIVVDKFRPLHLRYLSYDNLTNNFKLLLDKGDLKNTDQANLEGPAKELLRYFFVGISLPNDSFWVNLRPDSPDNIIDSYLARTDVGKILLEADLLLKRDTANFTSPQTPEGKDYWDKLYKKAGELFGSENITIPTLTRPWIVPGEIIIREAQGSAYIYKATLKVMLEQDYLKGSAVYSFQDERLKQLNEYSSQLIRESIIPKLTREINTSKRYAPLRQVYYSLILAQWFKKVFYGKTGLYSRLIDRKDLSNLASKALWDKQTYFKQYQDSFNKGEYNLQEPVNTPQGQTIRSYMSGGIALSGISETIASSAITSNKPFVPRADYLLGYDTLSAGQEPFEVTINNAPLDAGLASSAVTLEKIEKIYLQELNNLAVEIEMQNKAKVNCKLSVERDKYEKDAFTISISNWPENFSYLQEIGGGYTFKHLPDGTVEFLSASSYPQGQGILNKIIELWNKKMEGLYKEIKIELRREKEEDVQEAAVVKVFIKSGLRVNSIEKQNNQHGGITYYVHLIGAESASSAVAYFDADQNRAMDLLKNDAQAWVVFADMLKLSLRNDYYGANISDIFIADAIRITKEVLSKRGGIGFRLGERSDEIAMVLPGSLGREEVRSLLQNIQEEIEKEYLDYCVARLPDGVVDKIKGSDVRMAQRTAREHRGGGAEYITTVLFIKDSGDRDGRSTLDKILKASGQIPGLGEVEAVLPPYLPAGAARLQGEGTLENKLESSLKEAEIFQRIAKQAGQMAGVEGLNTRPQIKEGARLNDSEFSELKKYINEFDKSVQPLKEFVKTRYGDNAAKQVQLDNGYAAFMRQNLYVILEYAMEKMKSSDNFIFVVRGPPDNFYIVTSINGKWQITAVRQNILTAADSSLDKNFLSIVEGSGRKLRSPGKYPFKVVNDFAELGHYFGNQLIKLDNINLLDAFAGRVKENGGILDTRSINAALNSASRGINNLLSENGLGFSVSFEAVSVTSDDFSGGKNQPDASTARVALDIIEKLNAARKTVEVPANSVKFYSEYKGRWQEIENEIGLIAAKRASNAQVGLKEAYKNIGIDIDGVLKKHSGEIIHLDKLVEETGLSKEEVVARINLINRNNASPFSIRPAGSGNMHIFVKRLVEPPVGSSSPVNKKDIEILTADLESLANETSLKNLSGIINKFLANLDKFYPSFKAVINLGNKPTLLIPDVHNRRADFVKLLLENPGDGESYLEKLARGKIQIILLGDLWHSENSDLWFKIKREYEDGWVGVRNYPGMDSEMANSLGLSAIIMKLKEEFPDNFHVVQGDHDNILSKSTRKVLPEEYSESKLVGGWLKAKLGEKFITSYAELERRLPPSSCGWRRKERVLSFSYCPGGSLRKRISRRGSGEIG